MTEALIEALSSVGYNLIIEGTLRTSKVPLKTARFLRSRGYTVSLALMAVKPEISLISCQIRREQMRRAGTTPRSTNPSHHNKIVRDIVSNLEKLEASGLFEDIRLYNRAGDCLFPSKTAQRTASATLQAVLFGPWSDVERQHYNYLQRALDELKDGQ